MRTPSPSPAARRRQQTAEQTHNVSTSASPPSTTVTGGDPQTRSAPATPAGGDRAQAVDPVSVDSAARLSGRRGAQRQRRAGVLGTGRQVQAPEGEPVGIRQLPPPRHDANRNVRDERDGRSASPIARLEGTSCPRRCDGPSRSRWSRTRPPPPPPQYAACVKASLSRHRCRADRSIRRPVISRLAICSTSPLACPHSPQRRRTFLRLQASAATTRPRPPPTDGPLLPGAARRAVARWRL